MKFSIVTAAYNAAGTISDTIRSVAAQERADYEHLIIDGASTDETTSVVQHHGHDRLKLVSEPDAGCYDAMNKGLFKASGDVVLFLNADDFLTRPNALSKVEQAFRETRADCVVGQTVIVDQDAVRTVKRLYQANGFRPWMLRVGHMPPHPSFYAKREVLLRAGGFDTSYKISADFDLMVRLFLRDGATFATIPETLAGFREGGISTRNLAAKRQINREIARSLHRNGIYSNRAWLWARYPFKALQLIRKPDDYPGGGPDMINAQVR